MNKIMQIEKKIEDSVVTGYRAIENGVVSGYKKIEDKFVEAFLTPDEASRPGAGGAEGSGSRTILEDGLLTGLHAIENSLDVGFRSVGNAIVAGNAIAAGSAIVAGKREG